MESALFGLLFIVSSAGETLAVKALNYSPNPLQLPGYTAFLSNQMWLFMLPIYWFMPNKSWPTATLWLQYIGFGILTFAMMACSFGLYSWGKLVAASEAKSLPIHETTLNPIIKVKTVDVHAWR
jgi:hypothetical protein